MKKFFLTAISFITLLSAAQAFAQMDMMGQPASGQNQQQNQMGGQGMMNMGHGMTGGGMMNMRPCMMGRGMMGMGGGMTMRHTGMMNGPNMQIMQYMNELDSYLMNAVTLGLTEDQRNRIQKIKTAASISLIQKRADLQIAALKLQSLMAKANPDKKAVAKQIDEMSSMWRDMQKISVTAVIDARNILNSEQRQKMLQYQ